MAETYCGKNCAKCNYKDINCPGCAAGPGRQLGGDCDVAACCRDKGIETCDACESREDCTYLQRREQQLERKKRMIDKLHKQEEEIAKRAVFLGKWIGILFWLVVPGVIAGLLKNEKMRDFSPVLYLIGQIINIVCCFAYGVVLFKLSSADDRYRTAGICVFISSAESVFMLVLFGASETPIWTLAIAIPVLVVNLIGDYNEFNAHASLLMGIDDGLSDKWTTLWKWFVLFLSISAAGMLFALFAPPFGVILLLCSALGLLVVSIVRLVLLYRTADVFRWYFAYDEVVHLPYRVDNLPYRVDK